MKESAQKIEMDLNRGDFSSLVRSLTPLLDKLLEHDKAKAEYLLKQFDLLTLDNMPDWGHILHPVATEIIRQTENGNVKFFDNEDFSWIKEAESLYSEALSEVLLALTQEENIPAFQEIQNEQTYLTSDDKWKVIVLKGYGESIEDNIALFPSTMKLLNNIPGWVSAMYSILKPGKKILPHTGVYNGLLRYHLGISVPEKCAIQIEDEVQGWENGKSLVFDDSFEHSAWNESDKTRTVLFVDFLRPLPFPMDILNKWLVLNIFSQSDFIQNAKKNFYKYDSFQKEQVKLIG
ncbi:hypothetical protein PSECIP111951_01257 [Pseudoalteromonas holothuriae]|uniref:Aspartyl/asparaginy/proline hydroxylase domain-containing protein n=1 Tax=Pseudoalteromonas holothuriae TaxID=2963714 RepID=A0ABM9GG60_9GAMM|nr:aspartyl/asparaginyl beta-hydroxylase domain-containing protein [Pseudoalteromonas sp. CIP111951]CAH9055523.1 hypothetical protein PSECIP111951_01257 [Pseudoalteromonas sp. CIP111951]